MTAVERIQERAKSLGAYATKVAFERHEETGRYVGVVFLEMDEETTVTASAGPPEPTRSSMPMSRSTTLRPVA